MLINSNGVNFDSVGMTHDDVASMINGLGIPKRDSSGNVLLTTVYSNSTAGTPIDASTTYSTYISCDINVNSNEMTFKTRLVQQAGYNDRIAYRILINDDYVVASGTLIGCADWKSVSVDVDMSAYNGQSVNVKFQAYNDSYGLYRGCMYGATSISKYDYYEVV